MKNKHIRGDYYFILFIIILFFVYGFNKSMFLGPYSTHQWRQADCLSITYNYYKYDLNFFEPSINWVGNEGHGRVISEFPIIYYTVAQLWKIFGQNETIFRLINFLIVFIGLFYFYRTLKLQLSDNFWAIICVLFLFSSPIFVYYSNNFIANAPAFGLVLVALHFMWNYYNKQKSKSLYIGSFFFLFAGLLKITALLSFIGIIPIHIYFLFTNKKQGYHKFYSLIPFAGVFVAIFAWYFYAKQYNQQNINGIFLQGILPIWELDNIQIKEIATNLYNKLLPQYFNPKILFLVFLAFIFSIFNYKKVNKAFLFLTINCFFGVFLYVILFYQVFDEHDYYLINLLIIIPLVFITFFDLAKRHAPNLLNANSSKALAVISLILIIYSTTINERIKYNTKNILIKSSFILDKETQNYWNWYHWNYNKTFKALETIEPYLRELGIKHNDMVVSVPDQSINISLYLMKQKGFTDFGYGNKQGKERIEHFIKIGAKYLIINDKSMYNKDYLTPFLSNKIGSYKNVDIYRLIE